MGNSVPSTVSQENEVKSSTSISQDENYVDKCPSCSAMLKFCLDSTGSPVQYIQCSQMPEKHLFCSSCLSPWKPSCSAKTEKCSNQCCVLVATLLTCDEVTDPHSHVYGCPAFRACSMCYNLIMHVSGCKFVTCSKCRYSFCFICLQDSAECRKAKGLYFSLTCSKPRAGRQRFVT